MPAFYTLIWLVPLLPLLTALALGVFMLFGRPKTHQQRQFARYLSLGGLGLACLILVLINLQAQFEQLPDRLLLGPWFSSGEWQINLELVLDATGLGLALVAALCTFLVQALSASSLNQESGFTRVLLLMNLFCAGLFLLLLAGDVLLAFSGWEVAGASAFLLISYRLQNQAAGGNLTQAFITNRFGELGFLLALSLCLHYLDHTSWLEINARAQLLDTLTAGFILAGFLLAALVRAAQLPFSAWLGRTLDGPLPITGLIFAALLPHSGVFLLLRLEPMLKIMPQLMWILILAGGLTAIYGWFMGLTQSDARGALLNASQSQIGLMVLWCGLGWFSLAAWHLAAHTLVRTWQFLLLPSVLELPPVPARTPLLLRPFKRLQKVLHQASLHGFWLEPLSSRLLVRPTLALSQDLQDFDDKVIRRIVGQPTELTTTSSLAQWEDQQRKPKSHQRQARGLAGRLLEALAELLYRFEQQLLLKGSGRGFKKTFLHFGRFLLRFDQLLEQPRYLLLMFMIGLVVIL